MEADLVLKTSDDGLSKSSAGDEANVVVERTRGIECVNSSVACSISQIVIVTEEASGVAP